MEEYRLALRIAEDVTSDISQLTEERTHEYMFTQVRELVDRAVYDHWGENGLRLCNIHTGMIQRCYEPNNNSYRYYGERGIRVCDLWRKSKGPFIEWALENGYKADLSIDRIDNDGDYEPSNCQWLTKAEHGRKTRNRRSGCQRQKP